MAAGQPFTFTKHFSATKDFPNVAIKDGGEGKSGVVENA